MYIYNYTYYRWSPKFHRTQNADTKSTRYATFMYVRALTQGDPQIHRQWSWSIGLDNYRERAKAQQRHGHVARKGPLPRKGPLAPKRTVFP